VCTSDTSNSPPNRVPSVAHLVGFSPGLFFQTSSSSKGHPPGPCSTLHCRPVLIRTFIGPFVRHHRLHSANWNVPFPHQSVSLDPFSSSRTFSLFFNTPGLPPDLILSPLTTPPPPHPPPWGLSESVPPGKPPGSLSKPSVLAGIVPYSPKCLGCFFPSRFPFTLASPNVFFPWLFCV